ncbi:MAG: abortive infection system antitoxin AbiGi family protein [Clostridium chrysemydis]|uniref:abortive infection system antitoxin AbiGi family protein n=1 Tax=Clostridium chrysemydis TaxID=2665504 RepID=UPI003F377232
MKYRQSANTLFRFTGSLDWLMEMISNKCIYPRYNEEYLDYLNLPHEIDRIAIPMVCFCDIKLQDLGKHMELYNEFGIGLRKSWGISKGVQPIQYVNPSSILCKTTSQLFNLLLDDKQPTRETIEESFLYQLLYMKPLSGKMMRKDGLKEECNFHDEHEWRFIPEMSILEKNNMEGFIINHQKLRSEYYDMYSEALKTIPDAWLRFEYEDVKYIIVKHSYREKLIEKIEGLSINTIKKIELISKIFIYDEIEEDW